MERHAEKFFCVFVTERDSHEAIGVVRLAGLLGSHEGMRRGVFEPPRFGEGFGKPKPRGERFNAAFGPLWKPLGEAGEGNMMSVGIREAKARLLALARAAANGQPTLITDHGKPRAVITSIRGAPGGHPAGMSDLSKFKQSLLALPHALEIDF